MGVGRAQLTPMPALRNRPFVSHNPAGAQLALVFEVWDAAGGGGTGAQIGAGRVPLPPLQSLQEREEQAADVDLGQVCRPHCIM